jgi:hypothetical protein
MYCVFTVKKQLFLVQKKQRKTNLQSTMTSYPETLTVKKLVKMGFFTKKIYYISSSNDPNIKA